MLKVLVTGAAGFIGYHLCLKLINEKIDVIGLDNINSYYSIDLKKNRLKNLEKAKYNQNSNFHFIKADIADKKQIDRVFKEKEFNVVVNLAAQAGVRYSLENPNSYIQSNLVGFQNIIDNCVRYKVENFIYASSSSVYGGNVNLPFKEEDAVDHPLSLYAATKRSNELIAHSYSHLYKLRSIGLRFFTVYGPWGRPDMALFLFTKAIINSQPINLFNNGDMVRDFTFIDDVVYSIFNLLKKPSSANQSFDYKNPSPATSWAPYRIFNVGNSQPTNLINYVSAIEKSLGMKAKINFLPMQPGDVSKTSSDTTLLENWINYKPKTTIDEGVKKFVSWYREFYNI